MTWGPLVEPCPPAARAEALQVLYQRIPPAIRAKLVDEVLREAESGQVDLAGLWAAWERPWGLSAARAHAPAQGVDPPSAPRGRIVGAFLTQALAGRAAAVWAPEVLPSLRRTATAAALVRTALADLRRRGFRVIQAVLDESAQGRGAGDLIRGGMPRVTELVYLERDTRIPLADPPPPRLAWRSFDPEQPDTFCRLLQATYIASLDMPELDGIRSLQEVIEGHRATGRFVPSRWRIGQVEGEPEAAALLLLADIPDREVWEVVYLGLTPPARGRGLGRAAIAQALELAAPHAPRLELAVDLRNTPATRLYASTGFVPFDRRSVHLVVFPPGAGGPP
ncbi:Mycothiol acetyltransferase [Aquisphaera giovannonii]|uniref:Mycothiol acetyltransferase n=1 Tax=Aquisphaera giovannonii TaxID=406548 RepID=A0A5B9WGQ1_9BACT|nr:GNAT family N-acetyltransferase [Aquisphaera giovannonii]QEH39020.1 Mycothiol acetyltransferase [Aquisphaera giovannonii]